MPVYEFECVGCRSRTELWYATWRSAPRTRDCHCGSVQGRVPSRFQPDFGSEQRREMAANNLDRATVDEIKKHAAERRAEREAKEQKQLDAVVAESVRSWDPGARYTVTD